jgi:hypothetical protein
VDFEHGGVVALGGRNAFKFGFGFGGVAQFEPALGGACVVEVGIFERLHGFVIIDLKWESRNVNLVVGYRIHFPQMNTDERR